MELKIPAIGENFTGSVTIRVPEMPENFKFRAKYGRRLLLMKDQGESETIEQKCDKLELIADISQDIRGNFLGVALEEKETGRKITSVEELYCDEKCFEIVTDVALKFISGFASKN